MQIGDIIGQPANDSEPPLNVMLGDFLTGIKALGIDADVMTKALRADPDALALIHAEHDQH